MTLTQGDKAIVREIGFEVADVIKTELKENFASELRIHQATCPIGKEVEAAVNKAKGAKWMIRLLIGAVGIIGGIAGGAIGHRLLAITGTVVMVNRETPAAPVTTNKGDVGQRGPAGPIGAVADLKATVSVSEQMLLRDYVSLKEHIEVRLAAERRLTDIQLSEVEKARTLALSGLERRLDAMNEFRAAMKDQSSLFVPRSEFDMTIKDIRDLRDYKAMMEGKASQTSATVAMILGTGGLLLGSLSLILRKNK